MKRKGLLVLAIQLAVVLSIAAKYAWERHHCPMVWAQTGQYDPDLPLRGRYLALQLRVSACGLPPVEYGPMRFNPLLRKSEVAQDWRVQTVARDGHLAAVPLDKNSAQESMELNLPPQASCEAAVLSDRTEFFISEKVKTPTMQRGEQMWALVTVPPSGPPRPVQLAISGPGGWKPLDLR